MFDSIRDRSWGWLLGTLLFTALTACPTLESTPVPTAECTKQFEKCKLPDGPLGVCQEVACAEGSKPPCLKCFSQH